MKLLLLIFMTEALLMSLCQPERLRMLFAHMATDQGLHFIHWYVSISFLGGCVTKNITERFTLICSEVYDHFISLMKDGPFCFSLPFRIMVVIMIIADISIYHTSVLFACVDWLARRWLAKFYSPPSRQRKTKWLLLAYCHK